MKYCSLRFYPLNPLNYAVTEMDKVFDVIIIGNRNYCLFLSAFVRVVGGIVMLPLEQTLLVSC